MIGTRRRVRRTGHGALGAAAVVLFAAVAVVAPAPANLLLPAGAADGDAQPTLTSKVVQEASASPGGLIHYSINYTCSNNDNSST
ncbi:MAG TPA: hypothetical protein VGM78_11855, partial [Ilumatobacteraceae bacterium]